MKNHALRRTVATMSAALCHTDRTMATDYRRVADFLRDAVAGEATRANRQAATTHDPLPPRPKRRAISTPRRSRARWHVAWSAIIGARAHCSTIASAPKPQLYARNIENFIGAARIPRRADRPASRERACTPTATITSRSPPPKRRSSPRTRAGSRLLSEAGGCTTLLAQ